MPSIKRLRSVAHNIGQLALSDSTGVSRGIGLIAVASGQRTVTFDLADSSPYPEGCRKDFRLSDNLRLLRKKFHAMLASEQWKPEDIQSCAMTFHFDPEEAFAGSGACEIQITTSDGGFVQRWIEATEGEACTPQSTEPIPTEIIKRARKVLTPAPDTEFLFSPLPLWFPVLFGLGVTVIGIFVVFTEGGTFDSQDVEFIAVIGAFAFSVGFFFWVLSRLDRPVHLIGAAFGFLGFLVFLLLSLLLYLCVQEKGFMYVLREYFAIFWLTALTLILAVSLTASSIGFRDKSGVSAKIIGFGVAGFILQLIGNNSGWWWAGLTGAILLMGYVSLAYWSSRRKRAPSGRSEDISRQQK